jgi:pSer/pThr/pTyr-binding forkhead associated (FHA) protein
MQQLVLLAEDGPMRGKRFELHSSHLTIGRDPARCHIHYAGEAVSREHARIQPLGQGARLQHLSSTNQTFVNGQAVQDTHLNLGDRIRISQVTFRLEQS